jgi:microcystin-dependent protein
MADPFVAEIRIFAFNFAPTGWATCNGQLLPISQNTALFSLLGTTYGGDGKSTFALPDLQGSAPMHPGQGPGLSQHFLGEQSGQQFVTLIQSEMPFHTHNVQADALDVGDNHVPTPNLVLASSGGVFAYIPSSPAPALVQANLNGISIAGGSLPHNNMQPYLTLLYCIALQGIFPPRS